MRIRDNKLFVVPLFSLNEILNMTLGGMKAKRFYSLNYFTRNFTANYFTGMRIRHNKLYVMDGVYGLYSIDLSSKQVQFVIKINDVTPNLVFPDDFDITKDGHVFYFTDATTRFHVNRGAYAILEGLCFSILIIL